MDEIPKLIYKVGYQSVYYSEQLHLTVKTVIISNQNLTFSTQMHSDHTLYFKMRGLMSDANERSTPHDAVLSICTDNGIIVFQSMVVNFDDPVSEDRHECLKRSRVG